LIDPVSICDNKEKCAKNPDGSIDLALTLEFFPQRGFYAGIIIAIGTILICFVLINKKAIVKPTKNRW
jgi:uncharacterized membrane protein YfhO